MRIAKIMRLTGLVLMTLGVIQCARSVVMILSGVQPLILVNVLSISLEASLLLCVGAWLVLRFPRERHRSCAETNTEKTGRKNDKSVYSFIARVGLTLGLLLLTGIVLYFVAFILIFMFAPWGP